MENKGYVKKSTFILTIVILVIIFAITITCIILHYKNMDMTVNIPTVVTDANELDGNLNDLQGIMIQE
jgi:hypothetical protein